MKEIHLYLVFGDAWILCHSFFSQLFSSVRAQIRHSLIPKWTQNIPNNDSKVMEKALEVNNIELYQQNKICLMHHLLFITFLFHNMGIVISKIAAELHKTEPILITSPIKQTVDK